MKRTEPTTEARMQRTFEIRLSDGDTRRKRSKFMHTHVVAYIDGPEWKLTWLERLRSCLCPLPGQDEWNASYNKKIEEMTNHTPNPGAPWEVVSWHKTKRGAERAAVGLRKIADRNSIMAFVGVFPCTEIG